MIIIALGYMRQSGDLPQIGFKCLFSIKKQAPSIDGAANLVKIMGFLCYKRQF
jgi:hypothetical protein